VNEEKTDLRHRIINNGDYLEVGAAGMTGKAPSVISL
jgi:hypothetical protein